MDPNQTLVDLLDALDRGETGEALEHWRSLREWLKDGGYAPDFSEVLARLSLDGQNPNELHPVNL